MPEDSDNETIPDLCCPKMSSKDLAITRNTLGLLFTNYLQ